jgi:hypothetical protein
VSRNLNVSGRVLHQQRRCRRARFRARAERELLRASGSGATIRFLDFVGCVGHFE